MYTERLSNSFVGLAFSSCKLLTVKMLVRPVSNKISTAHPFQLALSGYVWQGWVNVDEAGAGHLLHRLVMLKFCCHFKKDNRFGSCHM
jgi:hypothetical protein